MTTSVSVETVRQVAGRLGQLADQVVFTGGAVVPLLVTDSGAAPARPTRDVDVIIDVVSQAEYSTVMRAQLRNLGFAEDTDEGAPICRWVVDGIKVDVMPADGSILGFSNRWFHTALRTAVPYELKASQQFRLISAPCFLATKIEAFRDRGREDFQASHDLEDLLAVLDGRRAIEDELPMADSAVRAYVRDELGMLLRDLRFIEALPGHLPADSGSQARLPLLRARLQRIAGL